MSDKNDVVKRNTDACTRSFNYSKGEVSLSFSLRQDLKQHARDFAECLAAALEDVMKEIESK